jgi:hypothetical protein
VPTTGITEFPKQITFTISPRTVLDGMFGEFTRPEAEPIVMFGGDDHTGHARILEYSTPLIGIKFGWIEPARIFSTVTPLQIGEGVHVEMDKRIHASFVPLHLPFTWDGQDRRGWINSGLWHDNGHE